MVQGVVVEDGYILDVNPSTNLLIEKVKCSTPKDVDDCVQAARAAAAEWHELGLAGRHAKLVDAIKLLRERPGGQEGLAALITQEMGKVISEARDEVEGAVNKEDFLRLVRAANEDEVIDPETGTTVVRDPHGVVAVVSPWNFPADEILLLTLPALMAGNTVVVKPSEVTPLTGKAVVECLQEALPPGVIMLLQGDGEVGKMLVSHKGVDMIGFTGSCATGRR
jgi:acyl-CoA reductase-like NAD-dependent aldehyde dehydrogenase